MKNIYDFLFSLLEEKKQVALASIVAAEGSTPQVVGASAVFSKEGLLAGTVGGGLQEAFCQKKAAKWRPAGSFLSKKSSQVFR